MHFEMMTVMLPAMTVQDVLCKKYTANTLQQVHCRKYTARSTLQKALCRK